MTHIPLVLFLGMLSTIQTHLAKALERQGIEVFDQIRARLQKSGQSAEGGLRKPIIYTAGVILNNTTFIYPTLAQPYGPPALFSSMFGIGLVFLMGYAAFILKETISRREMVGAAAIVAGTLIIGIENIYRQDFDRFSMNLPLMLIALGIWFFLSLVFVFAAGRSSDLRWIAVAFGNLAGGMGSLDPFFKGVGQTYGGQPGILPSNLIGGIFFVSSFIIGFLAFVVTQIGFARKARASLLIPVYNASYIGLPVLWQILLLPGYQVTWFTLIGLIFLLGGVALMQPFKSHPSRKE